VSESTDRTGQGEIRKVAALADPIRSRLYRFVVEQPAPIGREDAAHGVGVPLHTAKFHLDKLVDEGLLDVEFRRLSDRTGPGAGRPAKLYRRSGDSVMVSLPERHYELVGSLLATAVAESDRDGSPVTEALHRTSYETGRELGQRFKPEKGGPRARSAQWDCVSSALRECGYEPQRVEKAILLRNCPFHELAQQEPDLVCGMNLDLLVGLLEGLEWAGAVPKLDPCAGRCCVRIDLR
jgi:predicted ArsR family transcriptional regulator